MSRPKAEFCAFVKTHERGPHQTLSCVVDLMPMRITAARLTYTSSFDSHCATPCTRCCTVIDLLHEWTLTIAHADRKEFHRALKARLWGPRE